MQEPMISIPGTVHSEAVVDGDSVASACAASALVTRLVTLLIRVFYFSGRKPKLIFQRILIDWNIHAKEQKTFPIV